MRTLLVGVGLLVISAVCAGGYLYMSTQQAQPLAAPVVATSSPSVAAIATSTIKTIGTSVQGRTIDVHTFGTGPKNILFVGGIHGGYEANTVHLAEAVIEEFQLFPNTIPDDITVHIIPNLNPDGYALSASASNFDRRMNANGVDLNRNFDCQWQPAGTWGSVETSGGAAAFSEPEAAALRDYVLETRPAAAAFWHSKASAVYTSECGPGTGAAPNGEALMNTYASAANYDAFGMWTAYPVTGAAEDWLASIGITAITVELETRDSIEWERNWAGVQATLSLFAE